jgi:hypothetical protein
VSRRANCLLSETGRFSPRREGFFREPVSRSTGKASRACVSTVLLTNSLEIGVQFGPSAMSRSAHSRSRSKPRVVTGRRPGGQRLVVDLTQIHGYEDFAVVGLRRGKRIRLTKARAASGESSGQAQPSRWGCDLCRLSKTHREAAHDRPVSSLYIFLWITAEAPHKPARSPIRDKPNRDRETKRMWTPWPIPAIS